MHGHELAFTPPDWTAWLLIGIVAYSTIAMLFGCPYCFMPDMKWPATILKRVTEGQR